MHPHHYIARAVKGEEYHTNSFSNYPIQAEFLKLNKNYGQNYSLIELKKKAIKNS